MTGFLSWNVISGFEQYLLTNPFSGFNHDREPGFSGTTVTHLKWGRSFRETASLFWGVQQIQKHYRVTSATSPWSASYGFFGEFVSTAMPDSSWLAMLASPKIVLVEPPGLLQQHLVLLPNSLCCCSIPKFCYQNVFFVAKPNCFVAKFPGVLSSQSSFGHVQMSRDWIQAFLIVAIPCHTWCLIPFGKWGLWPGSFL